jgi:hypothetical protein
MRSARRPGGHRDLDLVMRACLAARTVLGAVVAASALALAPDAHAAPPAPPSPLSPAEGAVVQAGERIEVRVAGVPGQVSAALRVSRSAQPDAAGTLATDVASETMAEAPPGVYVGYFYVGDKAGPLYWQVGQLSCWELDLSTLTPPGCDTLFSPVRSLNVIPEPGELTVSANEVQRVTRGRLDIQLKCTLDCTVAFAADASVKGAGKRKPQGALSYTRQLKLAAGKPMSAGRVFTGAARTALRSLVRRHGTVLFRATATATDAYGRTYRASRSVMIRPKPKPARPAPPPGPPTLAERVEDAASAALHREYPGKIVTVDGCRRLDVDYWVCGYSGYSSELGNFSGKVYVRRYPYGLDATVI